VKKHAGNVELWASLRCSAFCSLFSLGFAGGERLDDADRNSKVIDEQLLCKRSQRNRSLKRLIATERMWPKNSDKIASIRPRSIERTNFADGE
jgi:hypothetical protein